MDAFLKNEHSDSTGTLLNVMWQPGWEESLGDNGYMYMYDPFAVHLKPSHC